jgi:hypothetical protein
MEIFNTDEYEVKGAIRGQKMKLAAKSLKTGGSVYVEHDFKGEKPTKEEVEAMYKKTIVYLCRLCTSLNVIGEPESTRPTEKEG